MHIMRKQIHLDRSELLSSIPLSSEVLRMDWRIYGGTWNIEDGWLTGKNPDNCPGMIIHRDDFPGNIMVDFEARTVLPCTHDIDFMWNGSWDEATNQRGLAYVGGLAGWWGGKVGIEKSPEYKLNALTPLLPFEPGRSYHIQGGSIDGHCFVFVDGRLAIELTDPDPIDTTRYTKIGFEAYCSHIQIRSVKIWRLAWEPVEASYTPEFG
jgi:hypothetical protein